MSDTEDDAALPRFFKVFLSETASESMGIPKSFNEHLEDPLPRIAKLQGTGGTWTVGFTKIGNGAYFTDGWSKFAEDHDLQDGEFLTFVYDGYHTFEVSLYGRSGCKETRAVTETVELSDDDSDSDEEEEEEEEEDPSMDGEDDSSFAEDEEVSQSIYTVDTQETESGITNLEVTANPCFTTNLKNRTYELLIPAQVVKDYGLRFGESINYIDAEGTMLGERGKWSDERVCFKGWDRICRRNRLQVQDEVKCEMLHYRKLVRSVKIHITRGCVSHHHRHNHHSHDY